MREVVVASMEVENKDLTIDGHVHYHIDDSYGADADGKRGTRTTIVDDVTSVQAYNADLDSVALSPEDLDRAKGILTREFLEE